MDHLYANILSEMNASVIGIVLIFSIMCAGVFVLGLVMDGDYKPIFLFASAFALICVIGGGITSIKINRSNMNAVAHYLEANHNYVPTDPLKYESHTREMTFVSSPDGKTLTWTPLQKECSGITIMSLSNPSKDHGLYLFVHPGKPDGLCKEDVFRTDASQVFQDLGNFLVATHQDNIENQVDSMKKQFEDSKKLN